VRKRVIAYKQLNVALCNVRVKGAYSSGILFYLSYLSNHVHTMLQ